MSLWPRHRCVYCGRPTRVRHPVARTKRGHELPYHPLACWRHLDVADLDPHYTLARRQP